MDPVRPVDERLVQEAVRLYKDQSVKVTFKGGISGSKPLYIIINGGKIEKRFYVQDQGIGGVNFNIKRNIRRKIFLSLLENFPEFQFASFKEITKRIRILIVKNPYFWDYFLFI